MVIMESTGYGSLKKLFKNKRMGGRRTSQQENPEAGKQREEKQPSMLKCPQCNFLSQNETYFNEHVSKVHANQPTCQFCFKAFDSYPAVRKHCESYHNEVENNVKSKQQKEGSKKPCRFFRNGTGQCSPPSGVCNYDHSIIPDSERELCYHKNACTYKPRCIFFHPEGQGKDEWEQIKRNPSKICHFSLNGGTCMRSVCYFFHPTIRNDPVVHPAMRNTSGFHPESIKKPPLDNQKESVITATNITMSNIPNLPMRVSVIVRNMKKKPDILQKLSQSLKVMKIN